MREHFSTVIRARVRDDNDEQGFTLIELLIVIVVLGILAAVTVFGLSGTASQSAQSACKSDARTVEVAVDAYHANDSGAAWPTTLAMLTTPAGTNGQPAGVQPYLRSAPQSSHYGINLGDGSANYPTQGHVYVTPTKTNTIGDFDNPPPDAAGNICQSVA
jgi:prepilin-type N-terminal cleavage/methylation domain-containing protein